MTETPNDMTGDTECDAASAEHILRARVAAAIADPRRPIAMGEAFAAMRAAIAGGE